MRAFHDARAGLSDDDLVARVKAVLPSVRADLEDLVRIESVWADPTAATRCGAARAVADLLSEAGFASVEIVPRARPAVIARILHRPVRRRYCCTPITMSSPKRDPAQWDSPPFEPTERDGRLLRPRQPTTRPASLPTWRRSGRTGAARRSG
jgi:acetylornithine deacetylase/succinyl-diaminopimelate desuccinylase-like protein